MSAAGYSDQEPWALSQDEADPLRWCREKFEHPTDPAGSPLIYLCGNSLGLMPRAARRMMEAELEDWQRLAVEGHFAARTPWYSYHERFRQPIGRLVGAHPGEVAVMNSLTVNLHLMLVSFYRPTASRWKILIEEAAFPSDSYAVSSHLASRGLDPEKGVLLARPRPGEATLRTDDIAALLEEQGQEIALVLLPGVQFLTGQWLDIPRLAELAHAAGAVVGFDLAHAAGNTPLSLHDWNVDFAVWCSYKYLNGGPGAIGGCFVHEKHGRNRALPRFAGWWGNDPSTRFRMHLNASFEPVEGADGWQLSNPPILAMTPLLAALDIFDGAGMPALREKSERLTGYLEFLLRRLPPDAVVQLTPPDPGARGCQLSLRIPHGAASVAERLRGRGIVTDFRPPDAVRVAPVPLYNTYHDVWRFWRAFDEILQGK